MRLLFFTPFGYALSLLNILKENEQFGVRLNFPKEKGKSVTVSIVPNPTPYMRLSWFINGMGILFQTFLGLVAAYNFDWLNNNSDGTLVGFVAMSAAFGVTQIFTAMFPHVDWNRRI